MATDERASITASDIRSAVARCVFSPWTYVCCPNVSHGWGLNYEADFIAITPSGYAAEVEIKISVSDLRADAKKAKWRDGLDKRIKRFYYAVPKEMVPEAMATDPRFGIISVYTVDGPYHHFDYYAKIERKAVDLRGHRKVTDGEVRRMLHLTSMRYWSTALKSDRKVL